MKFVLVYARIVDDKDMGSLMTGIYMGGVYDTKAEANQAAMESTTNTQGGTIIPKLFKMKDESLQDIVSHAIKVFDRIADDIYESEETLKC